MPVAPSRMYHFRLLRENIFRKLCPVAGMKIRNRMVAKRNLKNPIVRGGAIVTAILAETQLPPHTIIAKTRSAYDVMGFSVTEFHQVISMLANLLSIKENELSGESQGLKRLCN